MVIDLARLWRHLLATRAGLKRAFPDEALEAIEQAVHAGECRHGGELRVALETDLDWRALLAGETPRQRALEVFGRLGVWDTELNNGVLIYVLFADRDVEIVADRGFNGRVGAGEWDEVCRAMRAAFRAGEYRSGLVAGIEAVHALIAAHYPALPGGRHELPDRPALL